MGADYYEVPPHHHHSTTKVVPLPLLWKMRRGHSWKGERGRMRA